METETRFFDLLSHWEFSQHITQPDRDALCKNAQLVCYDKGEMIIKKDSPGRTFWVISKGTAIIMAMKRNGEKVVLHSMGPGDFFGEISLLKTQPRSVDVIADEDIELYRLTDEDFSRYLISNKKVAHALKEFARKRLEISDKIYHEDDVDSKGLFERLKSLFRKKK